MTWLKGLASVPVQDVVGLLFCLCLVHRFQNRNGRLGHQMTRAKLDRTRIVLAKHFRQRPFTSFFELQDLIVIHAIVPRIRQYHCPLL